MPGETPQQHTERMKRWLEQDKQALKEGKSHRRSELHRIIKQTTSSTDANPEQINIPKELPHEPPLKHVKTSCRLCGELLEFPANWLGETVYCPHCQKDIELDNSLPPPPVPKQSKCEDFQRYARRSAATGLAEFLSVYGAFVWTVGSGIYSNGTAFDSWG